MRRERGWTLTETIVAVAIAALLIEFFIRIIMPSVISRRENHSGSGVSAELVVMPSGVADMWRYHDEINLVTCWKIQEGRDLFCIPDWQLSPPPCGELERTR